MAAHDEPKPPLLVGDAAGKRMHGPWRPERLERQYRGNPPDNSKFRRVRLRMTDSGSHIFMVDDSSSSSSSANNPSSAQNGNKRAAKASVKDTFYLGLEVIGRVLVEPYFYARPKPIRISAIIAPRRAIGPFPLRKPRSMIRIGDLYIEDKMFGYGRIRTHRY